jgi:carbon monoxide dehydrogenase subunit G
LIAASTHAETDIMEMNGSRDVPASVEATWSALNDPEVLKACIAGCESIDKVSDNEYQVAMTARVGPVSAKFNGRIALNDIVAPKSYTIKFEGQGGAAGFASGEAQVELSPAGSGTRIDYKAKAQVGGKLAQIGSRLVDGAAAKVADDFFSRFGERLGGGKDIVADEAAAAIPPEMAAAALKKMRIRLGLAILIIVAMAIYWLTRPA